MVNMLLIVVEKVVLFFGESVGFEVDGEKVIGCRIDVWQDFGLFALVHSGGEVEGVDVTLLLSVKSKYLVAIMVDHETHPLPFGCFILACLMYLSPRTKRFHRYNVCL